MCQGDAKGQPETYQASGRTWVNAPFVLQKVGMLSGASTGCTCRFRLTDVGKGKCCLADGLSSRGPGYRPSCTPRRPEADGCEDLSDACFGDVQCANSFMVSFVCVSLLSCFLRFSCAHHMARSFGRLCAHTQLATATSTWKNRNSR